MMECSPMEDHLVLLIKAIAEKYFQTVLVCWKTLFGLAKRRKENTEKAAAHKLCYFYRSAKSLEKKLI